MMQRERLLSRNAAPDLLRRFGSGHSCFFIRVAVFKGLKLCTGKKDKLRLSRILLEEPLDWTG